MKSFYTLSFFALLLVACGGEPTTTTSENEAADTLVEKPDSVMYMQGVIE